MTKSNLAILFLLRFIFIIGKVDCPTFNGLEDILFLKTLAALVTKVFSEEISPNHQKNRDKGRPLLIRHFSALC